MSKIGKLAGLCLFACLILAGSDCCGDHGGGGGGGGDNPPATPPAAPSNLAAVAASSSQINLDWTDNADNEDGFILERKTGVAGTWAEIATVGANVASSPDLGLTASTTYYYRVRASNTAGNSTYSNEANATSWPSGMNLIPAGCFDMGDAFSEGSSDELPVHNVCITSSFYMDVHEVTNAEYAACVSGGVCAAPSNSASHTRTSYYGNATYNNFPVIYVSWNQANAYCAWAGKRLPTEAQWEYAARGRLSSKRYSWGDSISCSNANYGRWDSDDPAHSLSHECWNYGGLDNDTQQVGIYTPNGYGLYDMTGNVFEWTHDWYSATYYSTSPTNDPPGPASGTYRVDRGGGWAFVASQMRAAIRPWGAPPAMQDPTLGFRCAKD